MCISELLSLSLQMQLQTRSILASKCIPKLARSRPPSSSLGYTILASKCISKLAASRPPSASLSYTISGFKSISKLARSWPPSASLSSTRSWPPSTSPNSLNRGLQVHLPVHTMMASKCISKLSQSASPGAPVITLQYRLQPDWPYVYI